MKALILSCNTGQGHNAAGKALYEVLQARGVPCEIKDTLTFGKEKTSSKVSGTYVRVTTKAPAVFGAAYQAGAAVSAMLRHTHIKSPVYLANKKYAEALHAYIVENGIDTVLCPHLFPAQALTSLRKKYGDFVTFYGVSTDYACTPFWEECSPHAVFVPHAHILPEFVRKAMPVTQLVPTGIPVSTRFCVHTPQAEARRRLKLPQQGEIFLVMTGSMGYGDIITLVDRLAAGSSPTARVLVLTGNNQPLRRRIVTAFAADKRVQALPFTNDVPLYMDACTVLLTKPGGLSTTEAAVKNVPMVHTAPIPGCETMNARFYAARGLSIATHSEAQSAAEAIGLARNAAAQQAMMAAQKATINAHAAEDICSYIMEHAR